MRLNSFRDSKELIKLSGVENGDKNRVFRRVKNNYHSDELITAKINSTISGKLSIFVLKILNTMLIANPIYDAVFKYLLEDIEIARELLSVILGEEIISLDVRPQESTLRVGKTTITVYRVDFKAIVRTETGEHKKILIEIQKGKDPLDVKRFRKYLGENYKKPDLLIHPSTQLQEEVILPIVTVYFLGFDLDYITVPVLSVDCHYRNAATGEPLDPAVKEIFVELLTHNSKIIQIRRLTSDLRTRLERVLQVFNQAFQTGRPHRLDFKGTEDDDPLLKKIVTRLHRGALDEELQEQMDAEDEFEEVLLEKIRKAEQAESRADQSERLAKMALQQKEEALQQKEEALQQKEEGLAREEAFRLQIEALQKQIEKKD